MWGEVKLPEIVGNGPLIVREFGWGCFWRLVKARLTGKRVTLLGEVFRNMK